VSIRTAIYVRQSLDKQEGIDRQLARTRELAAVRGWTVVREFEDNAQSATKSRGVKSGWGQMLAAADAGAFTHVVAVDLDRLIRSQRDLLQLIDRHLKVVTVDGEVDLSTADGEFRASMMAALARFEVQRKGERQRRANLDRAARGKANPGRRRFGYETDGRTPREAEAVWVLWMFDQARDGASIRSITARLIQEGVNPGTGTEWSNRRVRDTLNNEVYAGAVRHLSVVNFESNVTPIVDPEVAAGVRAILAEPSRRSTPGPGVRHLMSGIARCGVCGATMYFMRSYRCRKDASHPSIEKKFLDARVAEEVFLWIAEHPEAEDGPDGAALAPLLAEAADVDRQRARAQEMALWDGADLPALRKTLATLGKRAETLREAMEAIRGASARSGFVEAVRGEWWARRDVQEFTEHEQAALDAWPAFWDAADLDKRRELVRSIMTVTVNPGRGPERIEVEWF
jgi:site-specific DNA recombinase